MTRVLMFTPLASADIEAAHAWYESQRAGLGNEFRAALGNTNIEVQDCLHQHRDPRAWRERA